MTSGLPSGLVIKNPPANAGDVGLIPEWGGSPGEGNGIHSNIFAWEIPRIEEPGGLQIMVLQKSQTWFKQHVISELFSYK